MLEREQRTVKKIKYSDDLEEDLIQALGTQEDEMPSDGDEDFDVAGCDDEDDEDFVLKESKTPAHRAAPDSSLKRKTPGTAPTRTPAIGGGAAGRAPKAPSLVQSLGVLSKEQLVKLILDLTTDPSLPSVTDKVRALIPAPDTGRAEDEMHKLARAVERAAPRYANGDHFHYKRVSTPLQTFKRKVLELSKAYAAGGDPNLTVKFVSRAVSLVCDLPYFTSPGDNKPREQTLKALASILEKALKHKGLQPVEESVKQQLQNNMTYHSSAFEKCLPLLV